MVRPGDPLSAKYPVDSVRDLISVVTHPRSNPEARPDEWENPSLERFLEAMAAWLSAFPQSYKNTGQTIPEPDWRFVADCLRAARIYE